MNWNLAGLLSETGSEDLTSGKRREFYLPLASVPPDLEQSELNQCVNRINNFDPNVFEVSDVNTLPNDTPIFQTIITPPPGGFSNDNSLPDPAIRLHSVSRGILTFNPDNNSLNLEMSPFASIDKNRVKWWHQWESVGCIPHKFIYENVDRNHLELRLTELPIVTQSPIPEESLRIQKGLSFPIEVTEDTKQQFIKEFLDGLEHTLLCVESGAFIGICAGLDQSIDYTNNSAERMVRFRVHYTDHNAPNNHYMNPREFFYLVFGDDSYESSNYQSPPVINHPFLQSINNKGLSQNIIHPETKRMLLRPPLRTQGRIRWESNWEISHHKLNWSWAGSITKDRYFNSFPNFNSDYNVEDNWKCNIFVSEICLRAGFRIRIFNFRGKYHYFLAEMYGAAVERGSAYGTKSKPALFAKNNKAWARRWDRKICGIRPKSERVIEINMMLNEEGRCFILVQEDNRADSAAHIAIIDEIVSPPMPTWQDDLSGLLVLKSWFFEAVHSGCYRRTKLRTPHLEPNDDLLLVELHPGKDPDTTTGLEDLNVI